MPCKSATYKAFLQKGKFYFFNSTRKFVTQSSVTPTIRAILALSKSIEMMREVANSLFFLLLLFQYLAFQLAVIKFLVYHRISFFVKCFYFFSKSGLAFQIIALPVQYANQ